MLKATNHQVHTLLIGFALATFFALVLVPTANAQVPFDATSSSLNTEQKEQLKLRLQEAQTRITELREKNKITADSLDSQHKLQMEELHNKSREQLEELRKKAEDRIKELRGEANLRASDRSKDSLNSDHGNAISEAAKQMHGGERSALFNAIIERLQKIDAERGDNNPLLKAAIEQLQKLRSQTEDEADDK